jgi:hypothetical protein
VVNGTPDTVLTLPTTFPSAAIVLSRRYVNLEILGSVAGHQRSGWVSLL